MAVSQKPRSEGSAVGISQVGPGGGLELGPGIAPLMETRFREQRVGRHGIQGVSREGLSYTTPSRTLTYRVLLRHF